MTIKYGRKIHLEKIESTKSKRKDSMRYLKQEEKCEMKGKIDLINQQGNIARPLKIIKGKFNTKILE